MILEPVTLYYYIKTIKGNLKRGCYFFGWTASSSYAACVEGPWVYMCWTQESRLRRLNTSDIRDCWYRSCTFKHKFLYAQLNLDHVSAPEDNNVEHVNKLFPVLHNVCSMPLSCKYLTGFLAINTTKHTHTVCSYMHMQMLKDQKNGQGWTHQQTNKNYSPCMKSRSGRSGCIALSKPTTFPNVPLMLYSMWHHGTPM